MESIDRSANVHICKPIAGTKLEGGILGDRYKKNIQNLFLKIDIEKLKEVFYSTHDEWYAEPEFVGKYIDTAIQLYKNERNSIFLEKAKDIVEVIISRQREDGYLGTYRTGLEFGKNFSIWNQAFIIMGLLSYYEAANDQRALNAAMRCADHIISGYMGGNHDFLTALNQGIQNSCIILQMARLYSISNKKEYLDFCNFIIAKWEATTLKLITNPSVFELGCLKGIEMLICYRGLVLLYDITNEVAYLEAASKYWAELEKEQIGITGNGTVAEMWSYIRNRAVLLTNDVMPNENCVAVGWMKLSADLFSKTGDGKYFDAFEKTLYNHLLGAQAIDGHDFSYYQGNIGRKLHETLPGLYSCCRYRGMNLLSYLPQFVYWKNKEGIVVSLYCGSGVSTEHNGVKVNIEQITEYPLNGKIKLNICPEKDVKFVLKLRVPKWCKNYEASINGSTHHINAIDGYIVIDKLWSASNNEVEIKIDMPFRFVDDSKQYEHSPAITDQSKSVAFSYGPILLAIDSNYGTPIYGTQVEVPEEGYTLEREYVDNLDGIPLLKFKIPGYIDKKPASITLVDYASAGSVDTKTSEFRVWLPLHGSENKCF